MTPNAPIATADTMFSQRITLGVSRARSPATIPVRSAHQATDPRNTPATTATAPDAPPVPAPMLANSAAKARIVAGLVSVRPTIEAQPAIGPLIRDPSERRRGIAGGGEGGAQGPRGEDHQDGAADDPQERGRCPRGARDRR